ncbi:MAG: SPOR domain-containing protein [Gammaproteobacteria bacterium]|nr:SPOR domain-containing protein [Gammaproteobacteria bacterium]
MNEQLKQRLVGATVLISLAVIFLPMIFDGGGGLPSQQEGLVLSQIMPPDPDLQFEPIEIPLYPPIREEEPPRIQEKITPADAGEEQPVEAGEVVVPAAQEREEEKAIALPPPRSEEVVRVKSPTKVAAFTVQIASFSSSVNATRERDRLIQLGFPAHIELLEDGSRKMYRVRVDSHTRDEALALQKKILAKAGVKGSRVMPKF